MTTTLSPLFQTTSGLLDINAAVKTHGGKLADALCTCGYILPSTSALNIHDHKPDCPYRLVVERIARNPNAIQFPDADRRQRLQAINEYLIEDDFGDRHLQALQTILSYFNWSEASEAEIFAFAERLKARYSLQSEIAALKSPYPTMQRLTDAAFALKQPQWDFDDLWLHLDYPQRVAVAVGKLNQQVQNNGFYGWHQNGYSVVADDLIRILREMCDCEPEITIVQIAVSILGQMDDLDEETYGFDADLDAFHARLDELDTQFYHYADALMARTEAFLKKNL